MTSSSSMHDTVAAVATPAGAGGVGVVRISGPRAFDVLRKVVTDWPEQTPSHTLRLSTIRAADGAPLDHGLAVWFKAPSSYTGEDVVELQCHGGPVIMQGVLEATLAHGARVANPGEFTQRAFLNGRLDLTQAEAVADLVTATSKSAHKLAMEHLQGNLGDAMRAHRDKLAEAATLIEAALDFSHEEHVYQIERDEVRARLDGVLRALYGLRDKFDQGRRQREGVRVVLTGPTNAGKSTLFNALYGSDRAIVTAVAGTTRDFLEEQLNLGGAAVRLVDTAGLRETEDEVESIGIERSRQWMQRADIVVRVVDQSQPLDDAQRQQIEALLEDARPVLLVLNKGDLPCGLASDDQTLCARFEHAVQCALAAHPPQGMDRLIEALGGMAKALTQSEGVLISRARHMQCVGDGIDAIERALDALDAGMEHELVALDVRDALDALGQMVGYVSADDILHRIFAEFCVGK